MSYYFVYVYRFVEIYMDSFMI